MSNRNTLESMNLHDAALHKGRHSRLARFVVMAAAFVAARPAAAQQPYEYLPYPSQHPHLAANPGMYPATPVQPEMLPEDRDLFYDDDSRLDLAIRESMRGAYMRLEYLNWDIAKPGNRLLGAPLADIDNPSEPFLLQTPTGVLAVGEVLNTDGTEFRDLNGIRGTIGIPLQDMTLEGNAWGLAQGYDTIKDRPFLRDNNDVTPRFIAISLLTDGQPGSRLLLFDNSFLAKYKTEAWGGDVNLYYHQVNPREGLTFQPLIGFRYMRYDESLGIRGAFDNSTGTFPGGVLADPIVSTIHSDVMNSVYSLQTGFKTEFRHPWFTIGAEPKVAFGANDTTSRVVTGNLRDFDDPNANPGDFDVDDPVNFRTEVDDLLFSPTLDVGVYAKLHLTQWMHLRVGYNFMLMANITRADRAIYYNDEGVDQPPAVVAQQKAGSFWIQGITVGGEILLP